MIRVFFAAQTGQQADHQGVPVDFTSDYISHLLPVDQHVAQNFIHLTFGYVLILDGLLQFMVMDFLFFAHEGSLF